ncbi:hypothetical protein GOODEAATRI_019278 [Goodea atripinnis]|uniref:RRP12 HEAT domain-containing protein n=1 Tax=Goodea atripinnis TaxID=208336 RepID=A0ABV0PZF7_9TELE
MPRGPLCCRSSSLQSLADLRSTPHFPFSGELDLAVGGAVESMGPEVVLAAVPLNITGYKYHPKHEDALLSLYRSSRLQSEQKMAAPPHANCKRIILGCSCNSQRLGLQIHVFPGIWSMLPGFCTCPVDLMASFKGVARTLGMAINERPDLRLTVCQALRTLINKSCSTAEEKAELGRFSKNFLPILFNVYSQQPAEGESGTYRMAVLDTIKVYLTVTDMQAKEPGMQKKAYRVLEEMCGAERDECKSFVVSNLETLKIVLLDTLKNASSPAKRVRSLYREEDILYARVLFIFSSDYFVLGFPQPRLKCLIHIVKRLNEEHKGFITALLPEVIICTKEVSVGARKNAYSLLVEIGSAFVRFCGNKKGLTGSVTMITCTVLALTRLVFEYKDSIEVSIMEQLLQNICLLLSSRTREVVKAALGFIKVILFIMDPKALGSHVTIMV